MHCEIDDDSDIRHSRRKWSDTRDGDRENILIFDGAFDRLNRGIKALDMADHQGHVGAPGGGDDGATFLHRRSNRLFDHYMDAAACAVDGNVAMKMCGRGDRHRIDAPAYQAFGVSEWGTAERTRNLTAALAIRISNA